MTIGYKILKLRWFFILNLVFLVTAPLFAQPASHFYPRAFRGVGEAPLSPAQTVNPNKPPSIPNIHTRPAPHFYPHAFRGVGKAPLSPEQNAIPGSELQTNWYDRIHLSGNVIVAAFYSNHTPTTIGLIPRYIGPSRHASDLAIYFTNLIAEANITTWASTFFDIAFAQRSPSFIRSPAGTGNILFLNNAYIVLADPTVTPLNIKVGRYFIDFGGFDTTSILESFTQLLSWTKATVFRLGISDVGGFSAYAYILKGIDRITDLNTTQARNYGFTLKLSRAINQFKYAFNVGYLANMVASQYSRTTVAHNSNLGRLMAYQRRTPGIDVEAIFNLEPFDASFKYVGSLTPASVNDIPYTHNGGRTFVGAKVAGWNINFGYSFDVFCYITRFAIGYQGSKQSTAVGTAAGSLPNKRPGVYGPFFAIGIPKTRYYSNYTFNFTKRLNLGFEVAKDIGYPKNNGGTGRHAYTVVSEIVANFA